MRRAPVRRVGSIQSRKKERLACNTDFLALKIYHVRFVLAAPGVLPVPSSRVEYLPIRHEFLQTREFWDVLYAETAGGGYQEDLVNVQAVPGILKHFMLFNFNRSNGLPVHSTTTVPFLRSSVTMLDS